MYCFVRSPDCGACVTETLRNLERKPQAFHSFCHQQLVGAMTLCHLDLLGRRNPYEIWTIANEVSEFNPTLQSYF